MRSAVHHDRPGLERADLGSHELNPRSSDTDPRTGSGQTRIRERGRDETIALAAAAALAIAACSSGSDDTATIETTPTTEPADRAGHTEAPPVRPTGDGSTGDRCPAGDGSTCRRVRRHDRARRRGPGSMRGRRRIVPAAVPVGCPHRCGRHHRDGPAGEPVICVDARQRRWREHGCRSSEPQRRVLSRQRRTGTRPRRRSGGLGAAADRRHRPFARLRLGERDHRRDDRRVMAALGRARRERHRRCSPRSVPPTRRQLHRRSSDRDRPAQPRRRDRRADRADRRVPGIP